jgi:methionine sulfoxide reductase heme-binding subunit
MTTLQDDRSGDSLKYRKSSLWYQDIFRKAYGCIRLPCKSRSGHLISLSPKRRKKSISLSPLFTIAAQHGRSFTIKAPRIISVNFRYILGASACANIDNISTGVKMLPHRRRKHQPLAEMNGIIRGGGAIVSNFSPAGLQSRISLANKILFALYLAPAFYLSWGLLTNALGANPAEALINESGLWSLRLLWFTLAVTPLRKITGWHWLVRLRRIPGLFCFFYGLLHLLFYLVFEQAFDVAGIITDIIQKLYIAVGFAAFLMLLPLAMTSTDAMKRRLGGRNWRNLHRLTYVAAIASAFHYLLLVKRDINSPAIYIVLLALLFLLRLIKLPVGKARKELT